MRSTRTPPVAWVALARVFSRTLWWTLVLGSCTVARPSGTLDAPSALLDALIAADNRADVAAIASCYAEDAVLLPPEGPVVVGRPEIRKRYAAGFETFRLHVSVEEGGGGADEGVAFHYGITSGEYVWLDGSPPTAFRDRYLMTLRRDAHGAWKVAALMWSHLEDGNP